MTDLIARLTAAVDETERVARAACHETNGEWNQPDPERHPGGVDDATGDIVVYDEGSPTQAQAAHIARHDPASVLRGCAADRKTLAIHKPIKTFAGLEELWPKHAGTPGFPIKVICERCANHDRESGWDDHDEDVQYPCPTLQAAAERYELEVQGG